MLKVTLADYGVGNLHSLRKCLQENGAVVNVIKDMSLLAEADCIAFPGVGAFDRVMERLLPFKDAINDRISDGIPVLGICIGAQILLEESEEGNLPGLGIIPGKVKKLPVQQIPHMGWNKVVGESELFDKVENSWFYFANSYHCVPLNKKNIVANTEYEGFTFPTLIKKDNVIGSQFHPEKSSFDGVAFISNFIKFAEENQ